MLTVTEAAARLSVSPHTVRRWTATGLLQCTRTAGGHRRIEEADVVELAELIETTDRPNAQLVRERETETFVRTSLALSRKRDPTELAAEVAAQMAHLLDCDYCRLTSYDPLAGTLEFLSDYRRGKMPPRPFTAYPVSVFPLVERVIRDRQWALVNISDADADPDELRVMRREHDKSLLMLPLVYEDLTIGLVEAIDKIREREHSTRELRFATAVAEQAAAFLQNVRAVEELRKKDEEARRLRGGLEAIPSAVDKLLIQEDVRGVLSTLAALAIETCGALVSVAAYQGQTVGATSSSPRAKGRTVGMAAHELQASDAHVLTSAAHCGDDSLTLTVSLPEADSDIFAVMLDFLTTAATVALRSVQ